MGYKKSDFNRIVERSDEENYYEYYDKYECDDDRIRFRITVYFDKDEYIKYITIYGTQTYIDDHTRKIIKVIYPNITDTDLEHFIEIFNSEEHNKYPRGKYGEYQHIAALTSDYDSSSYIFRSISPY